MALWEPDLRVRGGAGAEDVPVLVRGKDDVQHATDTVEHIPKPMRFLMTENGCARDDGAVRDQPSTEFGGYRDERGFATASARSLLLTILGELVLPHGKTVWTSSLLYVLTGLGIEEHSARQAIARGASAGWFVGEKHGREVCWTLAEAGLRIVEEGSKRVHSICAAREPWNGDWLILFVTIPQRQKPVRRRLYRALSWAGFGNPATGLWLSPHLDRAAEVTRLIDEQGLKDSTLAFVGPTISVGFSERELVRRAWHLDAIVASYERLINRFATLDPERGDEVLFTYLALVNEWQRFPFMDPQLPEEILPRWIGRRAASLFMDLRETWAEAAHHRWRSVVGETSPAFYAPG